MPSYELVYFDVRGRAELARCVFAAAGQSYKDTRLTGEQWAAQKGDTQYGQLPELKIDGKALCQSNSIARYLAREFGLSGKDNYEVGKVDMYVDLCNDLLEQFVKAVFEKDEAKKSELDKKLKDETVPKFMGFFERDLKNNGGKFLVGSSLTLADLAVQTVFDTLLQKEPGAMDKHPLLKAHREALRAAPKIGDYLKNRKTTDI